MALLLGRRLHGGVLLFCDNSRRLRHAIRRGHWKRKGWVARDGGVLTSLVVGLVPFFLLLLYFDSLSLLRADDTTANGQLVASTTLSRRHHRHHRHDAAAADDNTVTTGRQKNDDDDDDDDNYYYNPPNDDFRYETKDDHRSNRGGSSTTSNQQRMEYWNPPSSSQPPKSSQPIPPPFLLHHQGVKGAAAPPSSSYAAPSSSHNIIVVVPDSTGLPPKVDYSMFPATTTIETLNASSNLRRQQHHHQHPNNFHHHHPNNFQQHPTQPLLPPPVSFNNMATNTTIFPSTQTPLTTPSGGRHQQPTATAKMRSSAPSSVSSPSSRDPSSLSPNESPHSPPPNRRWSAKAAHATSYLNGMEAPEVAEIIKLTRTGNPLYDGITSVMTVADYGLRQRQERLQTQVKDEEKVVDETIPVNSNITQQHSLLLQPEEGHIMGDRTNVHGKRFVFRKDKRAGTDRITPVKTGGGRRKPEKNKGIDWDNLLKIIVDETLSQYYSDRTWFMQEIVAPVFQDDITAATQRFASPVHG